MEGGEGAPTVEDILDEKGRYLGLKGDGFEVVYHMPLESKKQALSMSIAAVASPRLTSLRAPASLQPLASRSTMFTRPRTGVTFSSTTE